MEIQQGREEGKKEKTVTYDVIQTGKGNKSNEKKLKKETHHSALAGTLPVNY